jgi:hypothetical protein
MSRLIAVERGIPLPRQGYRALKYPWAEMKVGDSFFVPCAIASRGAVRASVSAARRKFRTDYIHAPASENGVSGTRVWRTK